MANGFPTLQTRNLRTVPGVRVAPRDVRGGSPGTQGPSLSLFGDILDEVKRAGTEAIGRRIDRLVGGDDGSSDSPFTPCPEGTFEFNGRCVRIDPTAAMPGGDPFISTQPTFGSPTVGSFGIPAMQPAVVGSINGRPIRRCMPGSVLGKDDLCYAKGSIPRAFRKWKPAVKPPMTAADAKALRRIGTLQKKVKRLAGDAGMSCKKR